MSELSNKRFQFQTGKQQYSVTNCQVSPGLENRSFILDFEKSQHCISPLDPEFKLNCVFQKAHSYHTHITNKKILNNNSKSSPYPGRTSFCSSLACYLYSDPSVMDQEATPLELGTQPCLQFSPNSETKQDPHLGLGLFHSSNLECQRFQPGLRGGNVLFKGI